VIFCCREFLVAVAVAATASAPKNLVGGWLFHLWLFVSYFFQVGGGENEKMFNQSNFDFF
jgi:hypothetical protein